MASQVDLFLLNTSIVVNVINIHGSFYRLVLDLNIYLYCFLKDFDQVIELLLNN